MAGSWRIGRIAGITVRMHWTFLLLLVWVGVSYGLHDQSVVAALEGIALILAIFGCIVLHEAGHALMARRYGIPTQDITLLPIGGVARLQRMPSEPLRELSIAVAGPAVNVIISAAIFVGMAGAYGLGIATREPSWAASFLVNLMWVNVALVLFNLLPAFPMDGGRVLRALLATRLDYTRATSIAAGTGQFLAVFLAMAGLVWLWNPLLLLIAVFIFFGAAAELRAVQLRQATKDLHVADAMLTQFRALSPDEPLSNAVEELLAGSQQDFPIVDEVGLRGVLRRGDLIRALNTKGSSAPVASVLTHPGEAVQEDDPLADAFEKIQRYGQPSLPVLRGNRCVGLLTAENITELILVHSAMNRNQVPFETVMPRGW